MQPGLRASVFRLCVQGMAADLRDHESRIQSRCRSCLSSYELYHLEEVNLASPLK